MKRQNRFPIKPFYDVIIIGGGIVGSGLFRDLSLHGIECLLLEKGDFASQTSQRSSKMLHGGIRYLETFDFDLVREALHEKNLWLKLAPHLCKELPFHLPIYQDSKWPLWTLKIGLWLYDFLSHHQNTPHQILNKDQTIQRFPGLQQLGLKGSGVYHDAIMDDAKLALECLYDGLLEGHGEAYNYMEVSSVTRTQDFVEVNAMDRLTGEAYTVRTKDIVFATGPFTDQLMKKLKFCPWEDVLLPSKGIHIWLAEETLNVKSPMVLQTFDKRIIFVIPQRKAILVGTTETETQEDFFDIKATSSEINYLLGVLNKFFPHAILNEGQVLSSFAGVRPLVRQEGQDRNKTSRIHKVFRPGHNIYVIVGGKYTTFRTMVQDTAREIVLKRGKAYGPNKTISPLRLSSSYQTFAGGVPSESIIREILAKERPRTFSDLIVRRLGVPTSEHWRGDIPLKDLFAPLKDELESRLFLTPEDKRLLGQY